MATFWDKIKSVARNTDEKKEKEQKKNVPKVSGIKEKNPTSPKAGKDADAKAGPNSPRALKDANAKTGKKASKKMKKKAKKKSVKPHEAQLINRILVRPKISEAVMNQQTLGKYVFEVSKDATKPEIAHGIEAMYGVSVRKVNIICYKPKSHGFKGMSGIKGGYKKAIVSLEQGNSIELFKEAK